jgi:aminomethyltransferase
MLKRTPLFESHQRRGARLVEFGGWEMPVQYSSIIDEHLAVRRAGGLFDISHMGQVLVSGPAALAFLNQILTNDLARLEPGLGHYTLMCNPRGGVIDDLYAYRVGDSAWLLILNASRVAADLDWIASQRSEFSDPGSVTVADTSERSAAVALQGPRVAGFIDECFTPSSAALDAAPALGPVHPSLLRKNRIGRFAFEGADVYLARTGYSGEDGFEIFAPAANIVAIWDALLARGHACCVQPAGLGARDSLRTEMCYPLYGQDLTADTTPIEAGLGFFVALDKPQFVGREALAQQKAAGPARRLVAFRMLERGAPPRPHYPILEVSSDGAAPGRRVGEVTSGTSSPSLGIGIGLGYVPAALARPDTRIAIEIRGKPSAAIIVPKPIYRRSPQPN